MFIVIEGGTGIGKSTIAWQIAKRVSNQFKKLYKFDENIVEYYFERLKKEAKITEQDFIEKILKLKEEKKYYFIPQKALIYSQDDLQKALASWNNISIPDEMINITFNRDFYSEKQKDIIKMINMFRDHENLTLACVPIFANLDTQIKNLCKMKLTVKKRGKAIIHTPNKVIYSKDKWDQATNEKIEKEWIMKKNRSPNYSKLTTFRGLVRFLPMTKKEEKLYQEIKNKKRNMILKDEMHVNVDEEKNDPYKKLFERLVNGGVRNRSILEGFCQATGLTFEQLRGRLVKDLKNSGKPEQIAMYFWDKKAKNKELIEELQGIYA